MEALAIYFLKSALYMALFTGVYWLFLRNETFYRFNRIFLLSGLSCSVLLPLYTFTYEIKLMPMETAVTDVAPVVLAMPDRFNWTSLLLMVYIAGGCFLLLRHIIGLYKIRKTALMHKYTLLKGCLIVETPVFRSSFSVFNCIIINSSADTSAAEKKLILEHELAHVEQRHWADLLICQLFCAFQWFNPLAWIYLNLVKQNHEYLADQAVLEQGNSAAVYRAALINHGLGVPVFALASSFSRYDHLKRVNMMMKPASARVRKFSVLLMLPAIALFLWAFAEPQFIVEQQIVKEKRKENKQQKPAKGPKFVNEKPVMADEKQGSSVIIKNRPVRKKPVLWQKEYEKTVQPTTAPDSAEKRGVQSSFVLNGLPAKSQPLMLLDGIEFHAGLANIKPEEIEAVHVLKGATALAEYGERGRNGVIRITSKKSGLLMKTGLDSRTD